jgi:hypothetical protein
MIDSPFQLPDISSPPIAAAARTRNRTRIPGGGSSRVIASAARSAKANSRIQKPEAGETRA